MATVKSGERVTPDDIRARFREVEASMQATAKDAAPIGVALGVVALVVVIVVSYAFGRRGGRRRNTIVEIRRV